jgi:hypothetical protein
LQLHPPGSGWASHLRQLGPELWTRIFHRAGLPGSVPAGRRPCGADSRVARRVAWAAAFSDRAALDAPPRHRTRTQEPS